MQRIKIILIILIFPILVNSTLYDLMDNGVNTFSGDFFSIVLKNPAAISRNQLRRFSFTMKNQFSINNFGITFPKKRFNISLGALNKTHSPYYENIFNIKYSLDNMLDIGISYSMLFQDISMDMKALYKINLGLIAYPFTNLFKKSGNLSNFVFSFYTDNILKNNCIEHYYPITYGGGIAFFYQRHLIDIFTNVENKDKNISFGFGMRAKIINDLHLSFGIRKDKLSSVAFGLEYLYKDSTFAGGVNINEEKQSFIFGINITPGSKKNILISEYMSTGIFFYKKKQYEKAMEYFNKALGIAPNNPDAKQFIDITRERMLREKDGLVNKWILKIHSLLKKEKYERAEKEFARLRELYPAFRGKWKKLTPLFIDKKKLKNIEKDTESAKFLLSLNELKLLIKKDKLIEARKKMSLQTNYPKKYEKKFISVKNLLTEKINKKVKSLFSMIKDENSKSAIDIYKEILSYDGKNILAKKRIISYYLIMGEKFYRDQKYNEALSAWREVLIYEPHNTNALLYIDTVKKRMKK